MVSINLVTFDRNIFCEFFRSKNVFSIYNILGQKKWRIIASFSFWMWCSWSLVSSFAHLDMHMNENLPIYSLSLKNIDFSKEGPRAMFRRLWFSKHLNTQLWLNIIESWMQTPLKLFWKSCVLLPNQYSDLLAFIKTFGSLAVFTFVF